MFGLARLLPEDCGLAFFGGSPGPMELVVIFLVVLILFGPRRLPEIAKMIGKTLQELRRASEDFKDQVMAIETDSTETEVTVSPSEDAMDDIFEGDEDDDYHPDDEYGMDDEYHSEVEDETSSTETEADEPSPAAAYGLDEGDGFQEDDEASEERNDLAG